MIFWTKSKPKRKAKAKSKTVPPPVDRQNLLQRNHTLLGGVVVGIDGHLIEIQARAVQMLTKPATYIKATKIVGMPTGAARETLTRIHGAFSRLGIHTSPVEILVNLAPASIPKQGNWLDLPIAIIMLQASGYLPKMDAAKTRKHVFVGELGLHGDVRSVPGALSIAYAATTGQQIVVPRGNEKECEFVKIHNAIEVFGTETLKQVVEFFQGRRNLDGSTPLTQGMSMVQQLFAWMQGPKPPNAAPDEELPESFAIDFGMIRGQDKAKRAALICAAGGHNMLMAGPPGEGKSLVASALPGILPPLTDQEKVELTRLHSACGLLAYASQTVTRRPMRAVHCTASRNALVGGGRNIPTPGEITLAHLGVLFLDEFTEFSRDAIESLRQPMESGRITIARAEKSLDFPARFTLVAAMNPCPCGYYSTTRCTCKPSEVIRYQKKISGPILDRIDLQVQMTALTNAERFAPGRPGQSEQMQHLVTVARTMQTQRFCREGIPFNAAIPGGRVWDLCRFSTAGMVHFQHTVTNNPMSSRTMDRLAKISRTIADIEASEHVEPHHIAEAATFTIGGVFGTV